MPFLAGELDGLEYGVVSGRAEGGSDACHMESVGVGEVRSDVIKGYRTGGAPLSAVALDDAPVLHVVDIGDAGTNFLDLWRDDRGTSVQRAQDRIALLIQAELADPYGFEARHVEKLKVEADVGLGPGAVDLVWTVDGGVERANVRCVVGDHRFAEGHELCHARRPVGALGDHVPVVPF